MIKSDSPHTAYIVAKLERQLSTCSDSFEAPSGKIMLRVWCNDMAAILKLARAADPEAAAEIKALREALRPFADHAEAFGGGYEEAELGGHSLMKCDFTTARAALKDHRKVRT